MSYDDLEPTSWHHCHKELVPGFIFILYDNLEPTSWHLNAMKNLCQVSLCNAILYDDLLLLPHCHIAPLHHTITWNLQAELTPYCHNQSWYLTITELTPYCHEELVSGFITTLYDNLFSLPHHCITSLHCIVQWLLWHWYCCFTDGLYFSLLWLLPGTSGQLQLFSAYYSCFQPWSIDYSRAVLQRTYELAPYCHEECVSGSLHNAISYDNLLLSPHCCIAASHRTITWNLWAELTPYCHRASTLLL